MMRFILFSVLINLSSCWMLRAYKVRKLKLTDHEKLPFVTIEESDKPFYFKKPSHSSNRKMENLVDSFIGKSETAAFLVIRHDSLLYEKYFMGFDENSILPSNSMAKSFIGTLVGIAISNGQIKSEYEPITNYLPELGKRDVRFQKITIRHLLDMRSGLDFNEGSYNLKDDAVKLGFKPNLVKHLLKVKIKEAPGKFKYQSVNPQLLGLVIERATGQKLQDYFREKLWQPIGAEHIATWNVDSKKRKHVITSAAINATAHDFAKLGKLYLDNGMAFGEQIIDKDWVRTVSNLDTLEKYEGYKYQWWNKRGTAYYKDSLKKVKIKTSKKPKRQKIISPNSSYSLNYHTEAFNAFGFLEQIIYVNPQKKLILVRLGRGWPDQRKFTQNIYELAERL